MEFRKIGVNINSKQLCDLSLKYLPRTNGSQFPSRLGSMAVEYWLMSELNKQGTYFDDYTNNARTELNQISHKLLPTRNLTVSSQHMERAKKILTDAGRCGMRASIVFTLCNGKMCITSSEVWEEK